MNRISARKLLIDEIADRRVIWLGPAGEDARPLLVIPQFSHSYSLHSPLRAAGVESIAVETLNGRRQSDYEVSMFLNAQGRPMVESFRRAVSHPSLLLSYAPYRFLPFLLGSGGTQYLGNSHATFKTVSDKRVVEAELRHKQGISIIPWTDLPMGSGRMGVLRNELRRGPIVLRSSKQDGGAGHELIQDEEQLKVSVIARLAEPISLGPFLAEHLPLCVGACVFPDGGVTVHPPSFQLVGVPACTQYDFGYCGNDFGAASRLGRSALDRVEACVRGAGEWLHSKGFIGAFGVDAIARDDEVVFVEINPRFLGSSCISAEVDTAIDQPDIFLDHVMACLGMASYASAPLAEQAATQPARSHLLCKNLSDAAMSLSADGMTLPPGFTAGLVPAPAIPVGPRHLLLALRTDQSITRDGTTISAQAAAAVEAGLAAFTTAG